MKGRHCLTGNLTILTFISTLFILYLITAPNFYCPILPIFFVISKESLRINLYLKVYKVVSFTKISTFVSNCVTISLY